MVEVAQSARTALATRSRSRAAEHLANRSREDLENWLIGLGDPRRPMYARRSASEASVQNFKMPCTVRVEVLRNDHSNVTRISMPWQIRPRHDVSSTSMSKQKKVSTKRAGECVRTEKSETDVISTPVCCDVRICTASDSGFGVRIRQLRNCYPKRTLSNRQSARYNATDWHLGFSTRERQQEFSSGESLWQRSRWWS